MSTFLIASGALRYPLDVPVALMLIARWTVFLAVVWTVHAALAGQNPRWRVALWRAMTLGTAAIVVLACVPPVVQWRLASADRPAVFGPTGTSELALRLPVDEGALGSQPEGQSSQPLRRGRVSGGLAGLRPARPHPPQSCFPIRK